MKARLVFIAISSTEVQASKGFYEKLFGFEMARSLTDTREAYHFPISGDGTHLGVSQVDGNQLPGTMPCFAVDDLDAATRELKAVGGKVVNPRIELSLPPNARDYYNRRIEPHGGSPSRSGEWITMTIMTDPAGAPVGLLKLHEPAHVPYRHGKHATPRAEYEVLNDQKKSVADGARWAKNPKAVL